MAFFAKGSKLPVRLTKFNYRITLINEFAWNNNHLISDESYCSYFWNRFACLLFYYVLVLFLLKIQNDEFILSSQENTVRVVSSHKFDVARNFVVRPAKTASVFIILCFWSHPEVKNFQQIVDYHAEHFFIYFLYFWLRQDLLPAFRIFLFLVLCRRIFWLLGLFLDGRRLLRGWFGNVNFIAFNGKTVQTFAFPFGGLGVNFAIRTRLWLIGGMGVGEDEFLYLWLLLEHSRFNLFICQ
jgi:hypothetical protein